MTTIQAKYGVRLKEELNIRNLKSVKSIVKVIRENRNISKKEAAFVTAQGLALPVKQTHFSYVDRDEIPIFELFVPAFNLETAIEAMLDKTSIELTGQGIELIKFDTAYALASFFGTLSSEIAEFDGISTSNECAVSFPLSELMPFLLTKGTDLTLRFSPRTSYYEVTKDRKGTGEFKVVDSLELLCAMCINEQGQEVVMYGTMDKLPTLYEATRPSFDTREVLPPVNQTAPTASQPRGARR